MNPFLQNFKLKVIKVNSKYYETKTSDIHDGFVGKFKEVHESFLAEQQEKITVYDIPYIENILFGELRNAGRDMLLYIIYNIKKNEDDINLQIEKTCIKMKISKGTYYTAVQQLIDVGLICKKHTTSYWINPFYLFKGNRIDYYYKQCSNCVEIVAEIVQSNK
jgi:predicted transcriptional regulator